MIQVEFNVRAIAARLDAARRVLDDMTPIHQDIGEYMIEATRERFRRRTAPDGTRWREKSPTTIAAYLARGDGMRPHPLIGPSERLSTEIAMLATRDSTEVGSPLEYSGVMQHGAAQGAFGRTSRGGPIPWSAIPARQWLGISEADERNILDMVDSYLAGVVGE